MGDVKVPTKIGNSRDYDIADVCSVLLCFSGFCGCAGIIERRFLGFHLEMKTKCKNFDTPCVSKMMISPTFVLCGCVFQVFMAVLVSSRGDFLVFISNENSGIKCNRVCKSVFVK